MHDSNLDADLMIAGGSTAGLATAIYAVMSGLSCIVVDPNLESFDKACGEGLMPSAVGLLKEMGVVLDQSAPFLGIRYHRDALVAEGVFPNGSGLGVRRVHLRSALLGRAKELGAEFLTGTVSTFDDRQSHVECLGKRVRYLIGCDGLRSSIGKAISPKLNRRFRPRFGLRRHYHVNDWPPFVEVHWAKDFEIYVTPVSSDLVNVAVLYHQGRPFDEFLEGVPALKARLGEPVTTVLGAGPFESRRSRLQSGNIFLVGDAAGFLDPLTGEGNQLAIAAARECVACIRTGNVTAYTARWRKMTRGYWYLTSGLLWMASHNTLRRWIVPVARALPWLFTFGFRWLAQKSGQSS